MSVKGHRYHSDNHSVFSDPFKESMIPDFLEKSFTNDYLDAYNQRAIEIL